MRSLQSVESAPGYEISASTALDAKLGALLLGPNEAAQIGVASYTISVFHG